MMDKQEIVDFINKNPTLSIRKTASALGVCRITIERLKKKNTTSTNTLVDKCTSCTKVDPCTKEHMNTATIEDMDAQAEILMDPTSSVKEKNIARQYMRDTLEGFL